MKEYILLIIFLICSSTSAINIPGNFSETMMVQMVKNIIPKTQEEIHHISNCIKLPAYKFLSDYHPRQTVILNNDGETHILGVPVLPSPLPDPIPLENINITLPFHEINGDISLRELKIEGLSTLTDDLTTIIQIILLKVTFNYTMSITKFSLNGVHDIDLNINLPIPDLNGPAGGNGDFYIDLNNIFFKLGFVVVPNNLTHILIKNVSLDLGFKNIDIFFNNSYLGGEEVPPKFWENISMLITTFFPILWSELRGTIEIFLETILNYVIEDCTFSKLIGFLLGTDDLSCLKIPLPPSFPQTTTKGPVSSTTTRVGGFTNLHGLLTNWILVVFMIFLINKI